MITVIRATVRNRQRKKGNLLLLLLLLLKRRDQYIKKYNNNKKERERESNALKISLKTLFRIELELNERKNLIDYYAANKKKI